MSSMSRNNLFNRIKQLPTVFKSVTPYRWECPLCMDNNYKNDPYSATVGMNTMWDEQRHKYKFYMHCRNCKYTTPAYETKQEAFKMYNENIVSTEHDLTNKLFEENQG